MLRAEFIAMTGVFYVAGSGAVLFVYDAGRHFTELARASCIPADRRVVGCIFLAELLLVLGAWRIDPTVPQSIRANSNDAHTALGLVLYTRYVYYFQIAGLVLLVAMIGAIVLTLHHRPAVKRQIAARQNARTKATAIEIKQVRSGQGIEEGIEEKVP